MKKNNKKVEVETKVIEQPKVEIVVETPKKKRKHYRKPKSKIVEVSVKEIIEPSVEGGKPIHATMVYDVDPELGELETKPTIKEWIQAIRYGWATIPGFWNKVKWTFQLIKLNK